MKTILIFIILLVSQFVFADMSQNITPIYIEDPGIKNSYLKILPDGSVQANTKVVYRKEIQTCLSDGVHISYEWLILDISDTGEIKILKRYTEEEWEKLIK